MKLQNTYIGKVGFLTNISEDVQENTNIGGKPYFLCEMMYYTAVDLFSFDTFPPLKSDQEFPRKK